MILNNSGLIVDIKELLTEIYFFNLEGKNKTKQNKRGRQTITGNKQVAGGEKGGGMG